MHRIRSVPEQVRPLEQLGTPHGLYMLLGWRPSLVGTTLQPKISTWTHIRLQVMSAALAFSKSKSPNYFLIERKALQTPTESPSALCS